MPDRRRTRRWPRQLTVRFWKRGEEEQATRAISTNVSRTGIFVRTQRVLPSGTRLRLEVLHSGRSFIAEGVVMRALKTPGHLQSVMPSGMGIRFAHVEELLEDLLPGIDLRAEERVPAERNEPSPEEAEVLEEASEPAPVPPSDTASRVTVQPPPAGEPRQAVNAVSRFALRFRDHEQFRRAFERDISTGGLFISTQAPATLDSVIEVEVQIEGAAAAPLRLEARVVHSMPPSPDQAGNLLVGMGVQFLDVRRSVEALRALL